MAIPPGVEFKHVKHLKVTHPLTHASSTWPLPLDEELGDSHVTPKLKLVKAILEGFANFWICNIRISKSVV